MQIYLQSPYVHGFVLKFITGTELNTFIFEIEILSLLLEVVIFKIVQSSRVYEYLHQMTVTEISLVIIL